MSSTPIHVVVLAAGQGTRMKSSLPKVLHRVAGRLDDRTASCERRMRSLQPRSRSSSDTERTPFERILGAQTQGSSSPFRSRSSEPRTRCSRQSRSSPGGRERWCCCRAMCRS